jgi:hypothetical protein
VRAFITMQIRAGNGELAVIKWLQAHEWTAVGSFWGLFATGLIIAFALARDQIFSQLK